MIVHLLMGGSISKPCTVRAGSRERLRQGSWLVLALIALLAVMPARASAVSEMAIPFHGMQADLGAGPGHRIWFTTYTSSEAPVEVAPETTQEGTTTETFFGYFDASRSPVLVSHYLQLPFQTSRQLVPQVGESGLDAAGDFWSLQDHGLERTSPTGVLSEFPTGIRHPREEDVIGGPEGDLFFTTEERVAGIGHATPSGHVNVLSIGISGAAGETSALAFGAEGRLWFASATRLGSLSPTGPPRIKFVAIPHKWEIGSIAKGGNGDLWGIEINPVANVEHLVRIKPPGEVTEMCKVRALDLVSGAGGYVWFILPKDKSHSTVGVGLIDPHGNVSEYRFAHVGSLGVPVSGPEGDAWLTAFPNLTPAQETPAALPTDPPSKILRIDPHERAIKICSG